MLSQNNLRIELYIENVAKLLYTLARTILKIKTKLVCSICLDLYQTPTRGLHCDHIFCEKCISTYLEYTTVSKPPCPVCQKPISPQSLRSLHSLKNAIQFVKVGEQELRTQLNDDATEKLSYNEIFNLLQKNRDKFCLPNQLSTTEVDYTNLIKAHKHLVTLDNEVLSIDGKIPPGPFPQAAKSLVKTPRTERQRPQVRQTPVRKSTNKTKVDLFDTVKQSGVDNPLWRSTKTYKREKDKIKESAPLNTDHPVEFQDHSTKVDIVKWLTDTENNFNHILTPEENEFNNSQSSDFDLFSISQRHRHRLGNAPPISQINRQKLEQNKIRKKNNQIVELSRPYRTFGNTNRRARSLECSIKTISTKRPLKRHSITICESPDPAPVIEQINSENDIVQNNAINNPNEKNALVVDLTEDEYINKIDVELGRKQNKKIPSLLQQTIKEANKRFENANTASAWDRVKQIKKTMGKTERKTRKLTVREISHTSLTSTTLTSCNKTYTNPKKRNCPNVIYENEPLDFGSNVLEPTTSHLKDKGISKISTRRSVIQNKLQQISRKNSLTTASGYSYKKSKTPLKRDIKITNTKEQQPKGIENKLLGNFTKKPEVVRVDQKEKIITKTKYKEKQAVVNLVRIPLLENRLVSTKSNLRLDEVEPNVLSDNQKQTTLFKANQTAIKRSRIIDSDIVEINTKKKQETERLENYKNLMTLKEDMKDSITSEAKEYIENVNKHMDHMKIKSITSEAKTDNEIINKDKFIDKQNLSTTQQSLVVSSMQSDNDIFIELPQKNLLSLTTKVTDINKGINTMKPQTKQSKDIKSKNDNVLTLTNGKLENNIEMNDNEKVISLTKLPYAINEPAFNSSTITKNIDALEDDDIFMMPTQLNHLISQRQQEVCDVDDNIFKVRTQVFPIDSHLNEDGKESIVSQLKEKVCLLKNILNALPVDYINKSCVDLQNQPDVIAKMTDITKEIESLINHIPNKDILHQTRDVDIQTNDSKDIFSFSVSTQTRNSIKHAAVQTDYHSPGGFRISSTAMFNIQPGVEAEVQTEPACCTKCNLEMDAPNMNQISSDILSADRRLITKLSNKYILSETFDNIDFDTQDAIKGKQITSFKDSKETENCMVNQNLTPKNVDVPEASMICSRKVDEKKSFKRIRKPSSDSESENVAELPLNNKKNKYIDEDLSIYFESEVQKEKEVLDTVNKDNWVLTLSEESDGVNYKEVLENIIKKCDKETNSKTSESSVSQHNRSQRNVGRTLKDNTEEPATKRSKTQDIIRECEMIIQNACSESLRLEDTERCSIIKEPSKLTLAVLEKEFENNFIDSIVENVEDINPVNTNANKMDKKQTTKDKLSESLFTDDNFVNQSIVKSGNNKEETLGLNNSKQCLNDIIDNFNAIDDSFEDHLDAEVAAINVINSNTNKKVAILQDITVANNNIIITKDCTRKRNFKLHKETIPRYDRPKSDEIFLSDSDAEVVESTPPPEKGRITSLEELALLSQPDYCTPEQNLPAAVRESSEMPVDSCFVKPLTPPPEFQDFMDDTMSEIQVPEIRTSSITPDLLLLQNTEINSTPERKVQRITSTPFTQFSQVISTYSLNLSPIKHVQESKSVNPLQAAQTSKVFPLTLVRNTTPTSERLLLRTSTPKQRSILNYVQQSDASPRKTKPTQASRKPCVACTRMNKDQLLAITSLSNKKLLTYSNIFSPTVTHMVVTVNEKHCIKEQTMKYVLAVASGIWVLGFNWIEECIKQGQLILEEPFEALDISGLPGPRDSRLNRLTNPLFKDFKIYAAPPFVSTTQHEVEDVITLLGGEVVSRPDSLLSKKGKICLIITEAKSSQDFELYETWLNTLRVVTVDLEWLGRSVGQYQLKSLRSSSLCSEDSICNLGYPSELTVEASFSSSQTTGSM